MLKKGSRLVLTAICVLLVSQSAVAEPEWNDLEPPYGIDDRLTVSVAAAGDQSFQDTDLVVTSSVAVVDFDNTNQNPGCLPWVLRRGWDPASEFGEQIQAQNLQTGNYDWIGYGPGGGYQEPEGIDCYSADPHGVTGGASGIGSFVQVSGEWTLTFLSRQEYVGFWWSAGNDENYVQFLDQSGNEILNPYFSTQSLSETLFGSLLRGCVANDQVNPYCGNPNSQFQDTDPSNQLDYGPGASFKRSNPYQPYAFVHMRVRDGFYGIKFSGYSFEFDNLTIAAVEPDRGEQEQVIGSPRNNPTYSLATSPLIPVDPRSQSVSFPGIVLGGDAADEPDATLCFTQVTDSSGTTAVSSGDTTISLAPPLSSVSQFFGPPNFVFSGSQNEVQNFSSQIRIISSPPSRSVVTSTPVWIRVSVSPASSGGEATCATTAGEITSTVVELRPLLLTNKNQSQVSLD
jgi:hypothetical protein